MAFVRVAMIRDESETSSFLARERDKPCKRCALAAEPIKFFPDKNATKTNMKSYPSRIASTAEVAFELRTTTAASSLVLLEISAYNLPNFLKDPKCPSPKMLPGFGSRVYWGT